MPEPVAYAVYDAYQDSPPLLTLDPEEAWDYVGQNDRRYTVKELFPAEDSCTASAAIERARVLHFIGRWSERTNGDRDGTLYDSIKRGDHERTPDA